MRIMRWIYGILSGLLLASVLQGQTRIGEVIPQEVFLEAGGRQILLVLRGEGLKNIRTVEAVYKQTADTFLFVQPGPAGDNRMPLTVLARPEAPLGRGHVLVAKTSSGVDLPLSVKIELVPVGDARATKPDTATALEAVEAAKGRRVVVLEERAPKITATVPSPLYVLPDGRTQTLLIKGVNLQQVTDVRVRKASEPAHYTQEQGKLPMRQTPAGIEVDITATPDTPLESKYFLDLMIRDYLAETVAFVVTKQPPPPPASTRIPVINLGPGTPLNEPD